jgi:C4-dicarboxylate-specific signal transduction histidine kinase/CheY-like chemotaxis protein
MHSLLRRQLSRLGLSADEPPQADGWGAFLAKLTATYEATDEDRALLERSLALSSQEMSTLYESLRSRSEAALLEKNRELEVSLGQADAVMEAVADGILVVRLDGTIVTANRSFAEMWRIPEALLATKDDDTLLGYVVDQLADPAQFLARVRYLMESTNEHARDEVRLKDERVFERQSGPVRFGDGAPFGRIWCFRDVTQERKLAVERLLVSERLASLGRLTASVAHEINNPLAYVCANVDLVEEGLRAKTSLSRDTAELLDDVRQGLGRISVIVRDLRSSSRAPEEDCEIVDIESPLNIAIHMASNEIRHRAQLIRDVPTGMLVNANSMRLGQVFLNLLVNAAHAITEGRAQENTISVCVTQEGDEVCVRIADTGEGISPEHIERIFDPFFTTKPIGIGTGLGLSICRSIVDGYGGTISVTRGVERGTVFMVRLPSVGERVAPPDSMPRSLPVVGRKCRVLIIDDEPAILRALRRVLSDIHEVVTCERARDALGLLASGERFDVVLCDVMMPDMTGPEFYQRASEAFPSVASRVVFMTGGALSPQTEAFILQVGRVLEKPLRASDIREFVATMVS